MSQSKKKSNLERLTKTKKESKKFFWIQKRKSKVKKARAHGGCLGTNRRRRTRLTAKGYGEQ